MAEDISNLRKLIETEAKLKERVKELQGLYFISKLIQNDELSIKDILQKVSSQIAAYWQYPQEIAVEIVCRGQVYRSDDFKRSSSKLENDIVVSGDIIGSIRIFSLKEGMESTQHFLIEEKYLLDAVTTIISKEIERRTALKKVEKMAADNKILLDNIDIQIWYLLDEETYGSVNKAHAEYLAMDKEKIEYKKIRSIVSDPKSAESYIESNRRVFESGKKHSLREEIIKNNGEKRILELKKVPRLNSFGEVEYVVCTAQDITEQVNQRKRLEMTQFSVDKSDLLIFSSTPEGIIKYANETASEKLKLDHQELIGLDAAEFVKEKEFEDRKKFWNRIKRNGSINYERTIVSEDGDKIPLDIISHYFNQGDEEYEFVFAQDISARKKAEKKLKNQLKFNQMLADISSYFVRLPADSLFKRINYALEKIGGFFAAQRIFVVKYAEQSSEFAEVYEWSADDELIVKKWLDKSSDKTFEELKKELSFNSFIKINELEKRSDNNCFHDFLEYQSSSKLGAVRLLNENEILGAMFIQPNKDSDKINLDDIKFLKILAELITNAFARYEDSRKINYLTFHDSLTDLYNRKFIKEELRRLNVERMLPLCIIMADINGLKIFNDNYGHNTGDRLIVKAADILKENMRKEDILARWGGDEFIIFLPKSGQEDAELIMQRLKSQFIKTEDSLLPISMALGYAVKYDVSESIGEVINRSDNMMYKDKKNNGEKFKKKILNDFR